MKSKVEDQIKENDWQDIPNYYYFTHAKLILLSPKNLFFIHIRYLLLLLFLCNHVNIFMVI